MARSRALPMIFRNAAASIEKRGLPPAGGHALADVVWMAVRRGSMLGAVFCLLACVPGRYALGQAHPPAPVGPSTTDADMLASLNLDYPGMEAVKAAAQANDLKRVEIEYLKYRRTRSTAKWSVDPGAMPVAASATDDPSGDDLIRHHMHNWFYGITPKEADMGRDFDWTFNPIKRDSQGFTYEWTWCIISRTEFWERLVDAYWRTHNEKYAREWVDEMQDFAEKNPRVGDGEQGRVELWRTLDASIRMSKSWPYAYYHVLNSPSFTPQAEWTYLKVIHDHGILLQNGLNNKDRTGNWVSSECFGLYVLATLFPEMRESARWRDLATSRVQGELNRMVPADGFEAELTPSYHMVSLEGFLGILEVARLNRVALPAALPAKIVSMYRALVMVMAQDGTMVETNDSSPINAMQTARQGLKLMPDPLLEWAASGGQHGRGLPPSTMLPEAGFYAMRGGWKPDDFYLFFRAGPTGIGHEHEDMLEVVLRRWGKTLLLDPGVAPYDHSDYRRFMIGTAAHNTITVDGKWQHRGQSQAPVLQAVKNPWITTPLFDYTAGTYRDGYQLSVYNPAKEYHPEDWTGEKDRSVSHTRRVLYLRPYYAFLLDTVDGTGVHDIASHFNVASPSVKLDQAQHAAFSQNSGDAQVGLYAMDAQNLNMRVIQGEHGAPDIRWNVPTVEFSKHQQAPATFGTFLYPYRGAQPKFSSTSLDMPDARVWGSRVHTDQEDAEFAMSRDDNAAPVAFQSNLRGKVAAVASGVLLRKPNGSTRVIIGAWGLTSYSDDSLQLRTVDSANLLITEQGGHPVVMNAGTSAVQLRMQQPLASSFILAPSSAVSIDADGSHPMTDLSVFHMPQ